MSLFYCVSINPCWHTTQDYKLDWSLSWNGFIYLWNAGKTCKYENLYLVLHLGDWGEYLRWLSNQVALCSQILTLQSGIFLSKCVSCTAYSDTAAFQHTFKRVQQIIGSCAALCPTKIADGSLGPLVSHMCGLKRTPFLFQQLKVGAHMYTLIW